MSRVVNDNGGGFGRGLPSFFRELPDDEATTNDNVQSSSKRGILQLLYEQ